MNAPVYRVDLTPNTIGASALRYTEPGSTIAMSTDSSKWLPAAFLVLGAAVPVMLAVEAAHQPACDRSCLIEFTDNYLDAMVAHNPAALKLAPGATIIENGKPAMLGEGLWKTARSVASRQAFADTTSGEAGFFGDVIEQDGTRARFALRLKINHHQIDEIETQSE
jgi:hypothetical protein